ncbi:MAG: glutathione S-transferase N-terminal domain-containing protein [Betaproteobacteria bacterium]|nr:glutathione S-transferase N-terminal domain-containing protein [Betaproteobacteria bacterium]
MIDLYSWPTPNGQKIQIMLEEAGLEYRAHAVDIQAGEQFLPAFLAISPNNKIPAIVDHGEPGEEPLPVFESGAILLHLAEKSGRFLPAGRTPRKETIEWLVFQVSSLGPMLGQATHFRRYAKAEVEYAIERYTREAQRLYGVLERRLDGRDWLAAGEYTIADIATFPWVCRHRRQGVDIAEFPNVARWLARIGTRPAVLRGMDLLKDAVKGSPMDEKAHATLFGKAAT